MLCISQTLSMLKLQQSMSPQLTANKSQRATRWQPDHMFPGRRKDIWNVLTKLCSQSTWSETYTLLHQNKAISVWRLHTHTHAHTRTSHLTTHQFTWYLVSKIARVPSCMNENTENPPSDSLRFTLRIWMMHSMLKQRNMHFALAICSMHTLVQQKWKFSSVDRIHFTHRISLHTMLSDNENRPLRDTKGFEFHQRLVCKS